MSRHYTFPRIIYFYTFLISIMLSGYRHSSRNVLNLYDYIQEKTVWKFSNIFFILFLQLKGIRAGKNIQPRSLRYQPVSKKSHRNLLSGTAANIWAWEINNNAIKHDNHTHKFKHDNINQSCQSHWVTQRQLSRKVFNPRHASVTYGANSKGFRAAFLWENTA